MEIYKLFEDYKNQKTEFSAKAYLVEKDEVWTKVVAHLLVLDLTFLDKESKVKDEPASEVEGIVDLMHQLPELVIFFSFCMSSVYILSRSHFVEPSSSFLKMSMNKSFSLSMYSVVVPSLHSHAFLFNFGSSVA